MLKNYFKIAIRHFFRHKTYSSINLLGLSMAVTCCLLIGLFIRHEWSYDDFHAKVDRLYRPWISEVYQNEPMVNTVTPYPLGPALVANYPEVEKMTRVVSIEGKVQTGGEIFNERLHLVEPDFFPMFDFRMVQQSSATPLAEVNSVIVTKAMATKYFGQANPVGKLIKIQLDSAVQAFTVTGVAQTVPVNSSIQFDFLLSFAHIKRLRSENFLKHWQQVDGETYVLLRPGTNAAQLEAKFPAMVKAALGEKYQPGAYAVHLQPIRNIHLNNTLPEGMEPISNPAYSYILGTIAGFILLIACINFMTLSIGRSAGRAREVGVRKVMGAIRSQLIQQFWGEALFLTVLAVFTGFVLAMLLLPVFNQLADKNLKFSFDAGTMGLLGVLVVVVGLVAGSYPALVLSNFRPVEVLKGKLTITGDQSFFRRSLVIVQFALSVFLIVGTLVMNQQMHFLQSKPLGYQTKRIVVIPATQSGEAGQAQIARFREAIQSRPEVAEVAASAFAFGSGPWAGVGYTDPKKVYREFAQNNIDAHFIPAYGIRLKVGRNFQENNTADKSQSIIVNEALVKEYGWQDPLNAHLPGKFPAHRIIGVVENFNFESLHTPVKPLVLVMQPDSLYRGIENLMFSSSPQPDISVRLQTGNLTEQVALLEKTWKSLSPNEPFAYTFLDENLANQYRQEQRLGKMVNIASALSIFISCLGLFGLTTLAVARRTKEIGVRKVLGASVTNIVALLSKDFVGLVVIANVVAWPLAWYSIHQWLQDFAYQVPVSWWIFGLAGVATLVIALVTISFHAVRAALANPVQALRRE
ncbi:ABC transporter permease [Adhaeribacter pallidiroseus]|uniref:Macrolide export ATP-binding/permease protein MacB n=1 Tax=Adhaeribacter pallidiroseus TaxID=2072847 RepID=A0A369QLM9_9BACT|nr:ABC transporter permease [Adhaeribacter pallidiroseus]RDC65614.1 Macrolide export ATP-binding/permease protein MacB [Adhaeribacter pallidiroseus]